ncbi:MAG: DUF2332 domain-containing protein [Erythrobacter sp.]|jgi:hypothetical protein|nr:DUF2332 domain-containing protein [Erythrobacter sp.]
MGIKNARYRAIDPQATGAEAIADAFENQVAYCRDNGAPITASVCQALLELIASERGGVVMERVRRWKGAPLADALPLRIAGGLHGLHISGDAPELAEIYDGQSAIARTALIADALERHEAMLLGWLESPPQTNEAGRSSNFAAGLLWLAEQGLPPRFALNEFGSSAGINLLMAHYFYDLGGVCLGAERADMRLKPEWRGNPPPAQSIEIISARGCDVAPLDLTDPREANRLRAYIWPEFTERFERLEAAIEVAKAHPPEIARESAEKFVERVLGEAPVSGTTRIIMNSVVWQYVPADQRARITCAIETAGAQASRQTSLAWISLEANRDTHRHELTVRHWPGGRKQAVQLAVAHPHGAWIEWRGA